MTDQKQSSSENITLTLDIQLGKSIFRFSDSYETIRDHKTGKTVLRRSTDGGRLNVLLVSATELLGSLDDSQERSDDDIKKFCLEFCADGKTKEAYQLALGCGAVKCVCKRSSFDQNAIMALWECDNIV